MKKIQLTLIFFAALFNLPFIATSQQLAQQYNLYQKSAFTENKGQIADQDGKVRKDVKYLYAAAGFKLILKDNSFSYEIFTLEKKKTKQEFSEACGLIPSFHNKVKTAEEVTVHTHTVDVSFVGSNPNPEIIAEEKSSNYNNYYLAHTPEKGVTNVYSYSKLIYKDLYPNIDIVFYAKEEGKLKYDVVVHPGGKLEDVKMKYDGMGGLALTDGKLKVKTSLGLIKEEIPYSYLEENTHNIEVKYLIKNEQVSFHCGYDKSKTLIIDPTLTWGTYYGGSSDDFSYSIAPDSSGNVYITGITYSSSSIATTGAHQISRGSVGYNDAFLVKFNSNGIRQWGTYYGGSGNDYGKGLTTDGSGNVYITGYTYSASGIATTGAHQTSLSGSNDAFLIKFNSSGVRQWGTYYGGSGGDEGYGIAHDGNGNIYIIGSSNSTSGISTNSAHQTSFGGGNFDAFLVKFNSSGVRQWGTYYGGSGDYDEGYGITTDGIGNVYIIGRTRSVSGIATIGAHQTAGGGSYIDAFLAKFNSSGVRQWGTYYGGSIDDDEGYGITTDGSGNIYIIGRTGSKSGISTTGAHQTSYNSNNDAFVAKFNSSGVRQWGTYYGGSGEEFGGGIITDINGNIYFTGFTQSTSGIATNGANQTSFGGSFDAFLVKFNNNGIRQWGTYYGGNAWDEGRGITIDGIGNVYFTGRTFSTSGIATTGAHQTSNGGSSDAFLIKFCDIYASLSGSLITCSGVSQSYYSNNGNSFSYIWSITGGTIITGQSTDSIIVNWGSAGTGTVKVIISSSTTCKDSVTQTVTINQSPLANTGTNTTICSGTSIKIGFNAISGNTYNWTSKPAGFSSTLANPIVSPLATTTYYLTEAITSTGCEKTDSVTITVNPPIANNTITSLQKICLGQPAPTIIGSTPTGGGGSYSYKWESSIDSVNWYVITGAQDSSYIPTGKLLQTTWYRRTVTAATCTGSLSLVSKVFTIKVNPRPRPAINGDRFFCAEKIVKYGIRSGASSTVVWSVIGGQLISGQNTDTILVEWLTSGNGTVKVIETNSFGCSDSGFVSVTIYPLPTANFTATRECIGKTTSFTNKSTLANTYIWSFGDGDSATIANPGHTYKTIGTFQVTLITTSTNGCKDTFTKAVDVDPLPVANFYVSNSCLGDNSSFTNTSTSAVTYLWNFGDGNTSTSANPSYKYTRVGIINVKLKVRNGAGCADSVIKTITIYPLPVATISVIQDTATERTFTFISTENATQYIWSFGDGKIDSGKTVKHIYQNDSTYKITLAVRDTNGCTAFTDTTITVFTVGINNQQSNAFDLKLYPSPFTNFTTLEYKLQESAKVAISIYDLTGKEIIILQNGRQITGNNYIIIDAEQCQLKVGIYILKVMIGNQLISRQLIKLKE